MRKVLTLAFILFVFPQAYTASASSAPITPTPQPENVSSRQLKKMERRQKRREKLTAKIAHRIEKYTRKKGNTFLDDLDPKLRMAVIFGLASLVLSLLGIFASILIIFAAIAALIAAVFFVLWLVNNA